MFSDTHFHFSYLYEKLGANGARDVLFRMAQDGVAFGMDIGTKCDDLLKRTFELEQTLNLISDEDLKKKISSFLYVSAGIWPDTDEIVNRNDSIKKLEQSITQLKNSTSFFSDRLVALGEGGLDHHWNPSGADGRCESDFDAALFKGEKELFLMQLLLAKKMQLPFVVHSRDAYEDTLEVIKESGFNNGIIHCFSYGKNEARAFLDLGWYISFSGSITYTKKSRMEEMNELLRFIPGDRLLMETDSPYLSPVPLRGQMNVPPNVRHVYAFAASARGVKIEELCALVDKNIARLFFNSSAL